MERAGFDFSLKELDDSGRIEGLLAGFGDVDRGGDLLVAGCFKKSLAGRTAPLPMLLHHDLRRPIGAWKEWQERPDGLFVKGSLTLATKDAQEAYALAKDGALTGLSIGWLAKAESVDQRTGVRTIRQAELFEGSLVTVPMNERTVATVKAIAGARDIAELLQDAGVSSRRAKAAAGAAWKAINNSEDDAAADAELVALISASTARLNGRN